MESRLEVIAWPDVVSFSVELKTGRNLADREIRLSCRLTAEGSTSSTTSTQSKLRTGQAIKASLAKSFVKPVSMARVEASQPNGATLPVE